MKEKGILLPIFSLPSKYGIGDFGNEAYEFIDILSENGIKYWEILPINSCKGLPYSPTSFYALNRDYISLDKLMEEGLIKGAEPKEISNRVVYDDRYKKQYCIEAFINFRRTKEYLEFLQNKEIKKYAEYMHRKEKTNKEYYGFMQFMLYKQWMGIKKYANSKGVEIIGDMPFYPDFDSVDTMFHSDCFEMKHGKFTYEAGTPPDYFNDDGQKWGSPVYNVEAMKRDNYKYLVGIFEYYLKLFDKVRIDYFRGYDSFFKIPIGKSGKEGEYVDSVSYGFFDELFKDENIKPERMIVEDLGDIREETIKLREHYGFTRQKVLQFSIDLDNCVDTDNEEENVLIFPGNHDCSTIHGWYNNLDDGQKEKLKDFLRKNECNDINVNIGIMQYCMKCKARIVVITAQDILGLDDNSRMNLPGTKGNHNWSWKLTDFEEFKERIKDFK